MKSLFSTVKLTEFEIITVLFLLFFSKTEELIFSKSTYLFLKQVVDD